jgi:hypothetical protein
MSNITIEAPLINNGLMTYIDYGEVCNNATELITGEDIMPPSRSVWITIKTKSGKTVKVIIPNSTDIRDNAIVQIDGETI